MGSVGTAPVQVPGFVQTGRSRRRTRHARASLCSRACRRRILCALSSAGHHSADQSRSAQPSELCSALHSANVHRVDLLNPVHVRLRLYRRKKPKGRTHSRAVAGHPAIGSGAGLSFRHGHCIHRTLSWQPARPRGSIHLRHLHRPGMEHDILVLSIAANSTQRTRRDGNALPAFEVGAIHSSRTSRLRHRARMERHDELRRRLVLSRSQRIHQRAQPTVHLARSGFLRRRSNRRKEHARPRLGDRHHDPSHSPHRPVLLEAAGQHGRPLQTRTQCRRGTAVLGRRSLARRILAPAH